LQRRLLRYAASQLNASLDFVSTEALRTLALSGKAGQRQDLARNLRAERTPRELRLTVQGLTTQGRGVNEAPLPEYIVDIPGEIAASLFGLWLRIDAPGSERAGTAKLRNWKAGDRVRLRHSSAPRKVKEVLERMRVTGSARTVWPVLELDGSIVWMKGVELEPERGIVVSTTLVEPLERAEH
jgi:tRNA(Ile)-lysidine synthase